MNKSVLLAVFVSLAAGAYIYKQEVTIRDLQRVIENERASRLNALQDQERAKVELAQLKDQNEVFKTESAQLRKELAEGSGNRGETATTPPADASKAQASFMKNIAKMFTDPEMKKSMRVQQMVGIRMMYADLVKELGLSPQESEQLMEMLADRQMDLTAAGMSAMEGGDKDAQGSKITDASKRYEEQLKSVLGEERYKQMQAYETTMGDRWMMQQWDGQFAATGSPLEAKQKDQLLALIKEERQKSPAGTLNFGGGGNPSQSLKAIQSDEALKQYMTSQGELNQRVLTRSREFLNADQIATLEKVQKQQAEFMSMQLKMSRELLGGGNK